MRRKSRGEDEHEFLKETGRELSLDVLIIWHPPLRSSITNPIRSKENDWVFIIFLTAIYFSHVNRFLLLLFTQLLRLDYVHTLSQVLLTFVSVF